MHSVGGACFTDRHEPQYTARDAIITARNCVRTSRVLVSRPVEQDLLELGIELYLSKS